MNCLDEFSDVQSLRITFSLLGKICYCWGGTQESPTKAFSPEVTKSSKSAAKQKEIIRRSPLAGFDLFILERIVPLTFAVVLRPKFSMTDGQSVLVLNEITLIHCNIDDNLGIQYQEYLCNVFFPTINCPDTIGREFASVIARKDGKNSKKMVIDILSRLKNSLVQ